MTRSKCGGGSRSKSPCPSFACGYHLDRKEGYYLTANREESPSGISRAIHHPDASLGYSIARFFHPNARNLRQTASFLAATFAQQLSGRGHTISTDLISARACSSRRINPASIVFPTPTLSAISNLGRSDFMNFRTGRYW